MIRSVIINKYLSKEFIKATLNTLFLFFCLGFIINLFEEINFFKDFDVSFKMPLILSLLFVPSLLYNMFPFIILISGIWFFLKIKKTDESTAINVSGMSNFSIIFVPATLAIIIGIFFITSVNPITSVLVKKYEMIKGAYEKDQEYLAAITENGIWIKEKNLQRNNIIRSSNLQNDSLMNVTIYEFDNNNNFIQRIEASSADISQLEWNLNNVKTINIDGVVSSENLQNFKYKSMYDIVKIKSLYSNLDTVSFWAINSQIKLLEERGYSIKEMITKKQRSFAFPFYLLSMVLLSAVFTLSVGYNDNNWRYIFITILASVLIYFFNDFSAALGKAEKLPIQVAVWMPVVIIFIFSSVGIIHANQK